MPVPTMIEPDESRIALSALAYIVWRHSPTAANVPERSPSAVPRSRKVSANQSVLSSYPS
jgi:hypothetical protein